jgi:hypothetical protein
VIKIYEIKMSNRGRHYFYYGFDIHVRWLNPEPVPGWGTKLLPGWEIELGWRYVIWSPKVPGQNRKKVHSLSEPYFNPAIAATMAQADIDKIISTQARVEVAPEVASGSNGGSSVGSS